MIVHICCSVDSWFFLSQLKSKYPDQRLIGFFYNPNIHPYDEYKARLIDAKRSCDKLGIEFVEGEYDFESWYSEAKELASEPERGKRCSLCFDIRLYKTAKLADEMGAKSYTTTLLMSPKKDLDQLKASATQISSKFNAKFFIEDFRKNGGTQAQFQLAKEKNAYKQNYCGCMFALVDQRKNQNRITSELFAPLDQNHKSETSKRAELLAKRVELESRGIACELISERFANYHLISGGLWQADQVVASSIISYSVGSFDIKDEPVLISSEVAIYKKRAVFVVTKNFTKNLSDQELRAKLGLDSRSLTPIFVVEKLPLGKIRIKLEAKIEEDTRVLLVQI